MGAAASARKAPKDSELGSHDLPERLRKGSRDFEAYHQGEQRWFRGRVVADDGQLLRISYNGASPRGR